MATLPAARPALLLKFWQQLFHASIHLLLDKQRSKGKLTQADLRDRIAEIGPAQFEEIKSVLVQDNCIPAEAGERLIYIEFAAHFLEALLFCLGFARQHVSESEEQGSGSAAAGTRCGWGRVVQRTRLAGAADPVVQSVTTSQEAHEFYYKLMESSERASQAGNVVLAAIQRRRAARVAPRGPCRHDHAACRGRYAKPGRPLAECSGA